MLSVQDHGMGIPSDILDKLGTPFSTTKDNGTGLGLATCYSIASRHKASIHIDTGPEGTTFYVRFKTIHKNGFDRGRRDKLFYPFCRLDTCEVLYTTI